MTIWDIMRASRRLWFVTLAGVLLTTVTATATVFAPGQYYAAVQITILPPDLGPGSNAFTTSTYSLIGVAGALTAEVGSPANGAIWLPGSSNLPDVGVDEGFAVRMPNVAGQWSIGFLGPYLDVQAIGSDPGEVENMIERVVSQISDTLERWQREAGVTPEDYLRIQQSPQVPTVGYLEHRPERAVAAVLLLGVGTTVAALVWVETRSRRRGSRLSGARNDHGSGTIRVAGVGPAESS